MVSKRCIKYIYTLELRNLSRYHKVCLVVGMRIGQIVFLDCGKKVSEESLYSTKGKYQTSPNYNELVKNWRVDMLLPRMYQDYEVSG